MESASLFQKLPLKLPEIKVIQTSLVRRLPKYQEANSNHCNNGQLRSAETKLLKLADRICISYSAEKLNIYAMSVLKRAVRDLLKQNLS